MADRCADTGSGNEEHTGDKNDPPAGTKRVAFAVNNSHGSGGNEQHVLFVT